MLFGIIRDCADLTLDESLRLYWAVSSSRAIDLDTTCWAVISLWALFSGSSNGIRTITEESSETGDTVTFGSTSLKWEVELLATVLRSHRSFDAVLTIGTWLSLNRRVRISSSLSAEESLRTGQAFRLLLVRLVVTVCANDLVLNIGWTVVTSITDVRCSCIGTVTASVANDIISSGSEESSLVALFTIDTSCAFGSECSPDSLSVGAQEAWGGSCRACHAEVTRDALFTLSTISWSGSG